VYFKPAAEVPAVTDAAPVDAMARGAYLFNGLGHCMECHAERNALGAMSQSPGQGGSVLPGGRWYAPSLSDATQASVAAWSTDEVAAFLTTGTHARAVASGPMAEVVLQGTQYLSSSDAHAMALYLKALPQVPPAKPSNDAVAGSNTLQKGAKLYESHCADCHGLKGEGRAGAYPALAGNRAVTMQQSNNLINTVLYGGFAPATAGNPRPFGMPPFVLQSGDAELAAVLSYIRNAWGNRAAGVSEFDINKFRRAQSP
jgi:mono/diheme cytochrome c family protein